MCKSLEGVWRAKFCIRSVVRIDLPSPTYPSSSHLDASPTSHPTPPAHPTCPPLPPLSPRSCLGGRSRWRGRRRRSCPHVTPCACSAARSRRRLRGRGSWSRSCSARRASPACRSGGSRSSSGCRRCVCEGYARGYGARQARRSASSRTARARARRAPVRSLPLRRALLPAPRHARRGVRAASIPPAPRPS